MAAGESLARQGPDVGKAPPERTILGILAVLYPGITAPLVAFSVRPIGMDGGDDSAQTRDFCRDRTVRIVTS